MNRPEQRNPFANGKLISVDTDPDAYHRTVGGERGSKDFVMSRSALADFIECPSKWRDGYESKDTTATKWGTIMDSLILTPQHFDERFAIYPDTYPCEPTAKDPRTEKPWNNNSTFAKEWKRNNAGRLFIYREKMEDDGSIDEDTSTATLGNAQRAKARFMADERLASLVACSKSQVFVMAEYHDRATKLAVPIKVLLDLVPDASNKRWGKALADLKTARDASEKEFKSAVHKGFYDWQAAIYQDCYIAATGEDRTDFHFAVQENTPPYQPALWSIGCDWIADARAEVIEALKFYCWCVANNEWPGYPATTMIESCGLLSREAYMLRNIQQVPITRHATEVERREEVDMVP